MKIARIIFLTIGVILSIVGIGSIIEEFRRGPDPAEMLGYIIGSFLPAGIIFMIAYIIHKRIKRIERKKEKEMLDSFLNSEEEK